jgi:hypothetical protein
MKLKLIPLTAALLLGACAHTPSPNALKAAAEPLLADGSADFDSRDLAASRGRAVLDAERAAVARVAELYMDETAKAEKYSALESGILKSPQLYVARHKILSEGRDGASYKVRLKTWIYQARIASELRGLNLSGPAAAAQRAAFVERGAAAPGFSAAFREAFARRSQIKLEKFPFAADAAAASLQEPALLAAAASSGADLLLAASASASAAGAGLNTGFYPSRSEASVKVFDARTGKLLLELSSQANAIDSSEAASFSKALAAAGELLAQETAAKADRLLKPEAAMKLKIRNLDGIEALEKLKAQLLKLDVKGLRLESYGSGEALFDVAPRTPDAQEFASAVLRGDSMGLELEGTNAQEVVFSLQR